jgi:uncharacterized protein
MYLVLLKKNAIIRHEYWAIIIMTTNTVLWAGREYHSLEHCVVSTSSGGSDISSTIVGQYRGIIYQVQYHILTNPLWQTLFFEINSRINGQVQHLLFEGDGVGRWKTGDREAAQFQGCIDIDIPLTPFTNTLPINRLNMAVGSERQIQVLYIDLLEGRLSALQQKYTRRDPQTYHYENVPNDFEADIQVDEAGLVIDYPALFERAAIHHHA